MVVEVGYRPAPSAIPLGLISGISLVGSVHTYLRRRPNPVVFAGVLTCGGLSAYTGLHLRKHGPTNHNLTSGFMLSALMVSAVAEAAIRNKSSCAYMPIVLLTFGSMLYYGNEYIARYGPIRRRGS